MKTVSVILGIASAALVFAPTSSRANDSAKDRVKLRKIAFDYASCVVRKHHAKASEFILATVTNKEVISKFNEIFDSDCLENSAGGGVNMAFPGDTYQYALADALVNADFATRGTRSFDDRLPLAQPPLPSFDATTAEIAKVKSASKRKALRQRLDQAATLAWLAHYGECVVRHDPESARYWLLTRPDTPEEYSRIKALMPVFSECLDDGTVKFNRVTMRGTVAINYYRLAMATVVPGGGSSH